MRSGLTWLRHGWVALVLLAPFGLASWLLNDLRSAIVTFHGTDEILYHLPAIRTFAAQWPSPHLSDYSSATTPLFHLLFSVIGEWLGFDLPRLRAVNALISFLAAGVFFRIWRDQFRIDRASALLMTFLFLASPYFFGASFILLTDNLGWLFCLLTLYGLLEGVRTKRLLPWLAGCLAMCLALLTRQTLIWLALSAAPLAVLRFPSWRERGVRLGAIGLACLPLVALIWTWRGLAPPSFQDIHEAHAFINLRGLTFTLAVMGLYYPLIKFHDMKESLLARERWVWLSVLLGWGFLLLLPVGTTGVDDGFLWRASRWFPALLGSSMLFWALVPLGVLGVAHMCRVSPMSLGTWALLAFALTMLPSSVLHQKYFDPFIPVIIMLSVQPGRVLVRVEQFGYAGAAACFVAYAILPYLALCSTPQIGDNRGLFQARFGVAHELCRVPAPNSNPERITLVRRSGS